MMKIELDPPTDAPASPPGLAERSPTPPDPNADKGSMALGFGLAWLIIVVGHIVVLGSFTLFFLPELGTIVLAIVFGAKGKSRSALGVLMGLGCVFALALLLVAACFGIMSGIH